MKDKTTAAPSKKHSRLNSNINHTLKYCFSCHTYEAVLQTVHFISIITEEGSLIATIGLLSKLHLASDSFTDFQFHIIKVLLYPTIVDEPAKPVRVITVRIVEMIPDEVRVVCLALLGLRVSIKVDNGHGVGVKSPQRNVFLFQWIVCCLFAFISAHNKILLLIPANP